MNKFLVKKIRSFVSVALVFVFLSLPILVSASIFVPCGRTNKKQLETRVSEYLKKNGEKAESDYQLYVQEIKNENKNRKPENAKSIKSKNDFIADRVAMCSFEDAFVLFNNMVKFFIFKLVTPFIIVILIYAGYLLITDGSNESTRTRVRGIFKNLVIGLLIVLFAWTLVATFFRAIGYKGETGLGL
jgi:ABC-type multidrug transport system fused ATPase/permease subunit